MEASEVAALIGVTPRYVEMWRRAAWLHGSKVGPERYDYRPVEVRVGRAVLQLTRLSVPAPLVEKAAGFVRSLGEDVDGVVVVHRDGDVRLGGEVGQAAWVVALEPVPVLVAA